MIGCKSLFQELLIASGKISLPPTQEVWFIFVESNLLRRHFVFARGYLLRRRTNEFAATKAIDLQRHNFHSAEENKINLTFVVVAAVVVSVFVVVVVVSVFVVVVVVVAVFAVASVVL